VKTIIHKSAAKLKFYGLVLFLVGILIFGLYRHDYHEKERGVVTIITPSAHVETIIGAIKSKKYYFPWCYGARRLKSEQKIIFSSTFDAKKGGYRKGSACKGIE